MHDGDGRGETRCRLVVKLIARRQQEHIPCVDQRHDCRVRKGEVGTEWAAGSGDLHLLCKSPDGDEVVLAVAQDETVCQVNPQSFS